MIRFTDLAERHSVQLFFDNRFVAFFYRYTETLYSLSSPPETYVDQYMADLTQLVEQLVKLVQLGPRQFWSTVIFNKKCQKCICETLQNLPRKSEYK